MTLDELKEGNRLAELLDKSKNKLEEIKDAAGKMKVCCSTVSFDGVKSNTNLCISVGGGETRVYADLSEREAVIILSLLRKRYVSDVLGYKEALDRLCECKETLS